MTIINEKSLGWLKKLMLKKHKPEEKTRPFFDKILQALKSNLFEEKNGQFIFKTDKIEIWFIASNDSYPTRLYINSECFALNKSECEAIKTILHFRFLADKINIIELAILEIEKALYAF